MISAPDLPFRGIPADDPVPRLRWTGRTTGWLLVIDREAWQWADKPLAASRM